MKKLAATAVALILLLLLAGCGRIYADTDALIEKAREEIPISDADTIEIRYAGLCGREGENAVLLWFVSGNEYQNHTYLPMECTVVGEAGYRFVHTYKPVNRGTDIAVLQWKGGYAFIINNPDCRTVRITDGTGTRDVAVGKDACPYVFYNDLIPSEYKFLDENGLEL